jgi:nucleoside-diphosphate-sugar epimerase
MRVLVAGGTGAIGRPLLPALVAAGHEVFATTRDPGRAGRIESAGATAEIADLLEPGRASELLGRLRPEVVVDELTSLPQRFDPRSAADAYRANDRVRREGSGALIAAAEEFGVRRHVLQSVAFIYAPGAPGLRVEGDPVWRDAPAPFADSVAVLDANERRVTGSGRFSGVVLRYGFLYGPGTWYASDGSTTESLRERRYPVIGGGGGVCSLVHVSDAARATVAAVERGAGIYNIVDDDPAPFAELLPEFAAMLGAPPPRRVPRWLARVAAGAYAVEAATRLSGASNAGARDQLDWSPSIRSWRTGLRDHRDSLV